MYEPAKSILILAAALVSFAALPPVRPPNAAAQNSKGDYVVLLHGLGRSALSMKKMEWALKRQGYRVVNVSYPSTRLSVQEAATNWLPAVLDQRTPDHSVKVHFVTHSLGGIVLRRYLKITPRQISDAW